MRDQEDLPGTLEFHGGEKGLSSQRTMLPALGFSKPDLNPSLPRASIEGCLTPKPYREWQVLQDDL